MPTDINNRIARNTIFLYIRMLLLMVVSLYTSRVILQVIGVDDYGIYNIVGGIVVLFSFLNNSMINATQRFFSYYIGSKDSDGLENVFSASFICYLLVSIVVVLISETIGLWFLNEQLNIPDERLGAAKIVFQFSVITFILNLLRIPFNSIIIAHEEMSFYAYLSIFEALIKLSAVFCVKFASIDRLVFYSALMMAVPLLCNIIYLIYCIKRYDACKFRIVKDKEIYKGLMSFINWSLLGGIANVGAQQGGNFMINIYYGVSANAGFGVANQVSHAVSSFVNNFQTAFNPQIIKLYAQNKIDELNRLVVRTSILSFYLIWIISLPLLINLSFVFKLWLGTVPPYAVVFSFCMIVYYIIDAIQAPLFMSIYATGNIKQYQIWLSVLIFLNLPISWIALYLGAPAYIVLLVRVVLNIISAIIRTFYINRLYEFDSIKYLKEVVLKSLQVIAATLAVAILIRYLIKDTLAGFCISTILIFIISLLVIYYWGLTSNDRKSVICMLRSMFGNENK